MEIPIPNPEIPFAEQPEEILLAMLIFGEARGSKVHDDTRLAVGSVVRNRVLSGKFGGSIWRGVILRPFQFSCFNANDPNRPKLLEPLEHEKKEVWESCYRCAALILNGTANDITQRATHYYTGSVVPYWTIRFKHTLDMDGFHFFRDPGAFQEPKPEPIAAPSVEEDFLAGG
ncbi:MAG: cell wall hydrolase [Candidatus Binatia bacterium]|nr:cell wall hydrolase [Candidatus Binatia bacterium]